MPTSQRPPGQLRHVLQTKVLEYQPELEGIAAPGVAGRLIVAPPGEAELQAIVLIGDAETVPHWFEAGERAGRVIAMAGQVDVG